MPSSSHCAFFPPRCVVLLAVAASGWGLLGCAARAGGRPPTMRVERAAPPTAQVSDDQFAAAVHDLLVSDPGSAERAMRLSAVEGRQMTRAAARFRTRAVDRGIEAVSGGMYLVRVGERLQSALGPDAAVALDAAVHEL